MLNEEARVREEKKAAIDDATREFQKVVANVPVGENGELNKAALAFADDLQQQMLMQETLLKSGQLKPSQYTLMRQNLVDGTDIGFSLYQEYNDEFSKKMALNSDDIPYGERLSKVTLEMMENVEVFSNFKLSVRGSIRKPPNATTWAFQFACEPRSFRIHFFFFTSKWVKFVNMSLRLY